MFQQYLQYYLIGINVLGFLLFLVNMFLYTYTEFGQIDIALTIISILGASPGIILAILLFDRKATKGTMMSRVFVSCVFVIQLVILLLYYGFHGERITFAIWNFFVEHKIVIAYLVIINFVTMIAFGVDKIAAIQNTSRIRIVTLLGLAFIGGSIGGLIAMYAFRHKTSKDYFTVGIPLIILMQVVVLFFLNNMKFF